MAPEAPGKELLQQSFADTANHRSIPPLQHERHTPETTSYRTLDEFRAQESPQARSNRANALWLQLRALQESTILENDSYKQVPLLEGISVSPQRAEELRKIYVNELLLKCQMHAGPSSSSGIDFQSFQSYAVQKEQELWEIFHNELDLDGNGQLDAEELRHALGKTGSSHNHIQSDELMGC